MIDFLHGADDRLPRLETQQNFQVVALKLQQALEIALRTDFTKFEAVQIPSFYAGALQRSCYKWYAECQSQLGIDPRSYAKEPGFKELRCQVVPRALDRFRIAIGDESVAFFAAAWAHLAKACAADIRGPIPQVPKRFEEVGKNHLANQRFTVGSLVRISLASGNFKTIESIRLARPDICGDLGSHLREAFEERPNRKQIVVPSEMYEETERFVRAAVKSCDSFKNLKSALEVSYDLGEKTVRPNQHVACAKKITRFLEALIWVLDDISDPRHREIRISADIARSVPLQKNFLNLLRAATKTVEGQIDHGCINVRTDEMLKWLIGHFIEKVTKNRLFKSGKLEDSEERKELALALTALSRKLQSTRR